MNQAADGACAGYDWWTDLDDRGTLQIDGAGKELQAGSAE